MAVADTGEMEACTEENGDHRNALGTAGCNDLEIHYHTDR